MATSGEHYTIGGEIAPFMGERKTPSPYYKGEGGLGKKNNV